MTSQAQGVTTTCPYCGVGCGVIARAAKDGGVTITGDQEHPANFGRLCSKGSALGETLSLDDRLLNPIVGGEETDWDAALDRVAGEFSAAIARHGPDSVAFYVSGQLLTEDYYVANKLMKGFIGSANIDTNSRLCMASSVAGHKRAFGSDTVPGCYEDLELADLVILAGSNLAWCHPVLYQRISAAKATWNGVTVVVIDPRQTATCEIADLHLPIAPGSDVALFNGLLRHLDRSGRCDAPFVNAHTNGIDAALSEASDFDGAATASITGLKLAEVQAFYDLAAKTERMVTVYSQGVNQSASGTDKVNAIINCHLLTGRIGRPGMGPFSVTGQPNAMGGREVGGMANQLAAHMDLENPVHRERVRSFWRAPRIAERPGLKAVELFNAVGDGRIKALWIMGTNPAVSLPEARRVRQAIRACPFVAVSDAVRHTDTTALAEVLLPAAAWGEKDGTVTNSERRISRQRAFLPLPGEAKPDWWIICEVAKRLGFAEGFAYAGAHEVFDEHARLSAIANDGKRDFDIGALAGQDRTHYDALAPTQWPCRQGDEIEAAQRFFADGRFFTADGKARFIATPFQLPRSTLSVGRPLILNTGRIRDQWHTMTRTAKSARLMRHIAEPFIEIHPDDARRNELPPASLAVITSDHGAMIARVIITCRQRPGSVFVPMHWTDQYAASARVGALVAGNVDPVSGQPESKFTPVAITRWPAKWYGFAVLAVKPRDIQAGYWALAACDGGWSLELADRELSADWPRYARDLFGMTRSREPAASEDLLAYHDRAGGTYRLLAFDGEQLLGAIFIANEPVAVSRSWASALLTSAFDGRKDKLSLLAGRPGTGRPDPGAIVCSCFFVGVNQISSAVASGSCTTVDDIGRHLGAGTDCGSCRAEIRRLIDETGLPKAS